MTSLAANSAAQATNHRLLQFVRSELGIATCALFVVVAMQFPLLWHRSIHWDEFFHYSQLHQFTNGMLTQPLQTLHVRLFAWVLQFPGNGIDHIILIRFAMFAGELIAAASIAATAARFTDKVTGIICALAYIGGGFVFQHGFSFRADPMLAALLTASLWLVLCSRMRVFAIAVGGLLLATAFMISIKSVLFASAFAGLAWLRWTEEQRSRQWLIKLVALAVATVVAFVCIYYLHIQGLGSDSMNVAKSVVNVSANKMFGMGNLPYLIYSAKQVLMAPVLAACILFFPNVLLRSSYSMPERIALTGLFAPLTTLFFYHNTAPYYYTFMLPPVIVAASIVIANFRGRFGTSVVAGLFVFSTFMVWTKESSEPIRNQRILTAAAEEMFTQKVAYLDFCAFLGNFPKANAFMTPWGIELYKSGYYPSIRSILAQQTVPLVMDNDPMFTRLLETRKHAIEFLPDDASIIRASYIPLWGPYWIAGKKFEARTKNAEFEFFVPGPYTVQGLQISIDGKNYNQGDVVSIKRGRHIVSTSDETVKLVWGEHVMPPSSPAPTTPFWTPF